MTSVRLSSLLVSLRRTAFSALVLLLGGTSAFAQSAPGLVAAYSFDEGAGTAIGDVSGTGNNGTAANATWTTAGRYGQAIVLNGTNAVVTVPDAASLRLTSAMTLEAWIKPSTVSAAWRDVIYKGDDNYYLESTTPTSSRPAIGALFGSTHVETFGTAALAVNVWAHLAATYDGAAVRLYVNGTQVATKARTGNITTSTNPLQIGGDLFYGQFFAGVVDDVRIYNRALTAAQIQTDMNTAVGSGGGPASDLTISKAHTGAFTQGQTGAIYTMTVTNTGTAATSGAVTVVDTLPAGLTATALSGAGWSCTLATLTCTRSDVLATAGVYPGITVTVSVAATAPASVTNTATVSGGGDASSSNNSASDATAITQLPDLTLTKTHTGSFAQGQIGATYTLTVRNAGTGPTTGLVTLADTLPTGLVASGLSGAGWTCTLATMTCTRSDALAGGSNYATVTVTVNVAATAPSSVTNTATVGGGGDTNAANNSAADPTAIGALPDLTLSKTHSGSFTQGQSGAIYSLVVTNSGTGATTGTVTVVDTLPAGLTAAALSGSGWSCTVATLTCTRSDVLAAGGNYPGITVTVNVAGTAAASVTNTATVSGGGDANTTNNHASDVTAVTQLPDLTLTKVHAGNFAPGQTGAIYTVTVRNAGAGPTTGVVTMIDSVPTGLMVTALSGTGWACTVATLTCTRSDTLSGGASYSAITITVNVASTAPASVTNVAVVSGGGDANTANNTASDPTTIVTLSTGLVAAYSFSEGTGAVLADASGHGNNGAIANATWTADGKFGSALVFNGSTSRVTIPDTPALHLSAGMTLEAWVRPTVAPSGWRDLIYKGNDIYFLEASGNTSTPIAAATFGGNLSQANAPSVLGVGLWTHLAATYDGTAVRVYVNGVQAATTAIIGTIASSSSPLEFGGDTFYGQVFDGAIDEVRIYNVALSAAQIQADMNAPVSPAGPDQQAPTAPSSLGATANGGTEVDLTWTASTDNVGVTGYHIERCATSGCSNFAEVASAAPATIFSDTTVAANTSYSYRIRGNDAAGNLSAYSNTATAVTSPPDTENPSAPGTLTATAISGTQINVAWGAASDNVGVAGYRLERCQDAGCEAFTKLGTTITGTSFSDTNLSVNTSYSYVVRAQDAAGNLGPYSNFATAVTLSTNPSLVGAYSFDEGTGSAVNDLSGHGNAGVIANATWAAVGKFGKALSFNGNNAVVTIPDSSTLRLTSAMTLEAWVNPGTANSGWRDVVYKGNDNYYLEGATDGNRPAIGITVDGSHTETFGTTALPSGTWTFLAATYDGSALRFYVNGTQVGSQPRTGAIVTSSNPLQIGGDSIYGQFFQGMIDEVRIYSVALTPGQIQADMATAVGGASPALGLSTNNIDFGNQPVGIQSATQIVTVTNVGSVTLNISSVTKSGPQAGEFTVSNTCGNPIPPAGTCTISSAFTPVNGGLRNAAIVIADNAPGNPHSISLTGNGTGFSVSPQTSVLTANQTQQFTVNGAGGDSVIWSVDGVTGGNAASGTITAAGLYTPSSVTGTHTVNVANSDGTKSATATAYVTVHPGIFTHHNDNARTGQNLAETVLAPSNVNPASFGKLKTYAIDGIAHASPLYVTNVNIPSVGRRNVVYVATEHDSIYAFDADGPGTSALWHVSFINPGAGITSVPNGDTGECCDIAPEIGITGTPVIDTATGTLYVVAKTKEGASSYPQRLHALDLATGAEKFGGPVLIRATVPGNGTGSSGGQLSFNSLRENERTALLLYNGVVYFGFGSHGDNQPYHGWLLGYNATTLQQVVTFSSTPNGEGGGIWQSGGGLAIDSAGNFYFATGDGAFDVNTGGSDYGDTFLKFNPTTGVLDYFTPHDQNSLDSNNLDLDAGGMILLPDQPGAHPHLLVSAGKNGSIYVVDRDNMTHFHATDQNVQTIVDAFPFGTPLPGNYSSPVYFNGTVYFAPVADVIQAFKLTNGLLSTAPTSTSRQAYAYPGGAMSISANGVNNGILWAVEKNGTAPGTLHAYDPANLAVELYNSNQSGSRDSLDVAAKFTIPTVVNGRVFVATETTLTIYGLLP